MSVRVKADESRCVLFYPSISLHSFEFFQLMHWTHSKPHFDPVCTQDPSIACSNVSRTSGLISQARLINCLFSFTSRVVLPSIPALSHAISRPWNQSSFYQYKRTCSFSHLLRLCLLHNHYTQPDVYVTTDFINLLWLSQCAPTVVRMGL